MIVGSADVGQYAARELLHRLAVIIPEHVAIAVRKGTVDAYWHEETRSELLDAIGELTEIMHALGAISATATPARTVGP